MNRRELLRSAVATGIALAARRGGAQSGMAKSIDTPVLSIGYEESGSAQGFPIVLLHGFPDDVRAWDGVVPPLVKAGHRVLVPYLRGYGPTRFRDAAGPDAAAPRMAIPLLVASDARSHSAEAPTAMTTLATSAAGPSSRHGN